MQLRLVWLERTLWQINLWWLLPSVLLGPCCCCSFELLKCSAGLIAAESFFFSRCDENAHDGRRSARTSGPSCGRLTMINERGDSTMWTSEWTTPNKKFGSQHHPRSLVSFETLPVRLVHVACYQLESKYVKGVKQSTLVFKERVIRKIDNHLFMAYREFNFQIDWRKPKCRCKIGVQTQFLERHQTICTTRLPTIIAKITRSSQNHNQVSPTSISTDVPKSSSACCK